MSLIDIHTYGLWGNGKKKTQSGLHIQVFPEYSTDPDTLFYKKMLMLQWIDPIVFGIKPADIKVDYWKSAREFIYKMDSSRTPEEKLNCITNCMNVIMQGIIKFSQRSEPPGADDLIPTFNYVLIMSAPKMIYSNIK